MNARWSAILGTSAVAAILAFAYFTITELFRIATKLESDVAKAFAAAAGSIVVAGITVGASKWYEARARIQESLRAKKTPVYEEIAKTLLMYFQRQPKSEVFSEADLVEFFHRTTEQLVIWGSDDVLLAWKSLRTAFTDGRRPLEGMLQFESFLFALRRDLGHKNAGFRPGTVLSLWVNDLDLDALPKHPTQR